MRASLFACVTAGFVGVEGGFEKGRLGGKEGENAPTWWPKIVAPRQSVLLDGEWAYGFRASGDSLMADADSMPFNETMLVPACVDAADPGYYGNRGVSMYRTEFTTASDADYVLEFMACAFFCRVWVDGVEIEKGHVNGGYVPFQRRVPRKAGPRQLTVLADNRFNLTTAPMHTGGDFWHYGGLVRSVVLHALPVAAAPAVWRAYVTPKLDATLAERWTVDVDVVLADCAFGGNLGIDFAWAPDGEESLETTVVLAFFKGRAAHSHAVPAGAKTWSTTSSFLQTLSVWSAGGGVTERFGLRWWGSDAGRLTLNGEVLKLVGWNHHTQWPETAASPTEEQMDDDIALLVRGGANYVRGAHYPQDQRWLDRLDAAGLTMWEETLGPGVSVGQLNDEKWMAVQLAQLDAMQDASLNHASIMTWGFFNEGPSEKEESCGAYAACAARLQKRDSSRFVTWASNAEERDVCLDAATLVSFNGYPGWYIEENNVSAVRPFWNDLAAWAASTQPGKPFVISETGAGGIYEWGTNATAAKWTLKYQGLVIAEDVAEAIENNNISGITLWRRTAPLGTRHGVDRDDGGGMPARENPSAAPGSTRPYFRLGKPYFPMPTCVPRHWTDFKGNDGAQRDGPCDYVEGVYPPICAFIDVTQNRPGGENHKGVLDFWRREKPAFDAVAAQYNATKAKAAVV